MSERLSTAGMLLNYAVEETAGTRPTAASAYTEVPEVKSVPSLNPQPNLIDSTTLKETEYTTHVMGLKDLGSALDFTANLTNGLITAWSTCVSAYQTAKDAGKAMWFCVTHPDLDQAVYFTGQPAPLGLNGASVGAMAETSLYIAVTNAPAMYAKPTV